MAASLASIHARLLLLSTTTTSSSFIRTRLPCPLPIPPRLVLLFNHRRQTILDCRDSSSPVERDEGVKESEIAKDPVREAAEALDVRVGKVLRAWRHPEADSLYVEEVDVGEPEPRTICSGLVSYIPLEQLQDSKVVVLANLKPRNMRGIKSNGMLMAASDEPHENVELLIPPEGSIPGERIWFGSEDEKDKQSNSATPNQVQKKKIWESVQPHLKTTEACVAVLGTLPMRTSAGDVTCKSLKNARIS